MPSTVGRWPFGTVRQGRTVFEGTISRDILAFLPNGRGVPRIFKQIDRSFWT